MHINYCLYQQHNIDALAIYHKWREVEKELILHSRYFSYTFLPQDEDNIKFKSITRKKLEEGLQSGEVTSFSMQNERMQCSPIIHILSVQDKREFGKIASVDFHLPDCCVNTKARQKILEAFVQYLHPTYGFVQKLEDPLESLYYHYQPVSSAPFGNERENFVDYMKEHDFIEKPRMLYTVNYLTQAQLDYAEGGIRLRDFIDKTLSEKALQALDNGLYKLCIKEAQLVELNDIFGKAGFLVNWWDKQQYKQQRDEARKQRRGW